MPAPRLVLAIGATCAVLLMGAAALDLGDPRAAARGRMVDAAEAAAARVKSRWEELRRGAPPPGAQKEDLPEGLGALRPSGASTVRVLAAKPTGPSNAEDAVFDVLLEAAIASAAARDFGAALAGAEAALAERPQAGGAARAHFHAARWWSALGSEAETDRHRRRLLELPTASKHGTSLALLACLLPPVDPGAAESILRMPEGALPRPKDRVEDDGTRLRFMADPWWASIEKRLRDTGPDRDWDRAFQTEARIGDALAAAFPGIGPEAEGLWSLAQVGRRHLAARSSGEGVRYAEIREDALLDALRADLDPAAAGGQRVGLTVELSLRPGLETGRERGQSAGQSAAARPDPHGVRVHGPEPLAGTHLAFTLHHPDPEASALPELSRQRLLRVALVALSGLILLGAIVASVTMTRAQRLAELRSTFVASVSHDLRTPTQAILLMAETLEQGRVKDAARRASYHGAIRKEAQRLRRQVEDLLDGARIDRGDGARVERESVSTESYLDGLGAAMAERAEAAGATLSITRAGLPATLDIDPEGVRRAIWNLLENALLHGARDGAAPRVEISIKAKDGSLIVAVQDDGPGVPARHRASIFEPFRQAKERGNIASDTGTGLGLAIVRALARAHGGDVELSPTDAGARFTVWFRFAAPSEEIPA